MFDAELMEKAMKECVCGTGDCAHVKSYFKGYNQCLEDKKEHRFDLQDMRIAWNKAFFQGLSIDDIDYVPVFFEDFIESLLKQQKK